MNIKSPPLILFPILGILAAWRFRPPETDWRNLQPSRKQRMEKRTLHFPDGSGIRFIRLPGTDLWLSQSEISGNYLNRFPSETRSHAGARAFAEWVSARTGESVRLPTAEEWRTAAGAGFPNAEFPWGYGPPDPPEGVHFGMNQEPQKPGAAFGYGFRDLAGGKWEWTAEGLLLGSAWAERHPETLYIDHAFVPPEHYAGRDTAIRLVWEKGRRDPR